MFVVILGEKHWQVIGKHCGKAGVPPKVVQKWLGHSTLEMTMNVYTHVNAEEEQKETLKFDTYFDTCLR